MGIDAPMEHGQTGARRSRATWERGSRSSCVCLAPFVGFAAPPAEPTGLGRGQNFGFDISF